LPTARWANSPHGAIPCRTGRLDADDRLVGDIATPALEVALRERADIVHFICLLKLADSQHPQEFPWASPHYKNPITNPKLTHALLQGGIGHHLWGKLFRTEPYRRALDRMGKELETTRISYEEDLLHLGFLAPLVERYQPLLLTGYCHRERADSAAARHAHSREEGQVAFQNFCHIITLLAASLPPDYVPSLNVGSIAVFSFHHENWQRWSPEELAGRVHRFVQAYPPQERGKAFGHVAHYHRALLFTALPYLPCPVPQPLPTGRPLRLAFTLPEDGSPQDLCQTLPTLLDLLAGRDDLEVSLVADRPEKVAADARIAVHPLCADPAFRCECWQSLLARYRPDICVCSAHWLEHNYLDIIYLALQGIPVIAHEHGSFWDFATRRNATLHSLALRTYSLCAAVVCQSRTDVILWRASNYGRAVCISDLLPAPLAGPAREEGRILCVGALEGEWANGARAEEIFTLLHRSIPSVRLTLVGLEPDGRHHCREFPEERNGGGWRMDSGWDWTGLCHSALLLVATTPDDGWPSPAFMAKVHGIPVVRFAANPSGGRTDGYLDVANGDTPALVEALRLLLQDSDKRRELGEAGFLSFQLLVQRDIAGRWKNLLATIREGPRATEILSSADQHPDAFAVLREALAEMGKWFPRTGANGNTAAGPDGTGQEGRINPKN
jgi:hypothetical protein